MAIERVNASDKELNKFEEALGAEKALLAERIAQNESAFEAKTISEEKYSVEKREQAVEAARIKGSEDTLAKLDKYVFETGDVEFGTKLLGNRGFTDKIDNSFTKAMRKAAKGELPHDNKGIEFKGADFMQLMNERGNRLVRAAAVLTTGNAPAEVTNTSEIVDYLLNPIDILSLIEHRTTPNKQIRHIREDLATGKTEINVDYRAEGGAFSRSDYDTKVLTRDTVSVGTYISYTEETDNDGNLAHFLPYVNERLPQDFMLQIEKDVLNGTGTTANPDEIQGFLGETGVQTPDDVTNKLTSGVIVATEGYDFVLQTIRRAGTKCFVGSKRRPNALIIHPTNLSEILGLTNTDGDFILQNTTVSAPLGGAINVLWRIPVIESLNMPVNNYAVVNTEFIKLFYNAHQPYRIRRDYVGTEMLSNIMTAVIDSDLNQYTIRPSAICKFSQAT